MTNDCNVEEVQVTSRKVLGFESILTNICMIDMHRHNFLQQTLVVHLIP